MDFKRRIYFSTLLAIFLAMPAFSQLDLMLQASDTMVCPETTTLVKFTVNSPPPVFITYLINGEPMTLGADKYNYNFIPFNEPGFYPIIAYGNDTDTIRNSGHYISVEGSNVNAELRGGGIFCGDDKVQAIEILLSGYAPWELSYTLDGIEKNLVTNNNSFMLADYSGANVKLVEVKDPVCSRKLNDSVFLGIYHSPKVTFTGENHVCTGTINSFTVDYNENYAYSWTVPESAQIIAGDTSSHLISLQWDTASIAYLRIRVQDTTTPCYGANYNKQVRVYDVTHNQLMGDENVCLGEPGIYSTQPVATNYYQWDIPSRAQANVAIDSNTTQFELTWAASALDTVKLRVNSKLANCQSDWMELPVMVNVSPSVTIDGDAVACEGTKALFQADYAPQLKYDWNIPALGTPIANTDIHSFLLEFGWSNAGTGLLSLLVTDTLTSCSQLQNIDIEIHATPKPLSVDTASCFGVDDPLWVNTMSPAENTVYWVNLDEYGTIIQLNKSGDHRYIESTPYGCTASGSFRVTNTCSFNFFVPEIFSPNGDGINDELLIFGEFESCIMQIYTVSGELVYDGTQSTPPWDGTLRSKTLPVGTYLWKALVVDYESNRYRREGTVTLIR